MAAAAIPPDHRDELLHAFKVTEDDVALNARGRLGPRQLRRIRQGVVGTVGLTAVLLVVLGGIVLATATRPIQLWRWGLIVAMALALVVVGLVGVTRLRGSAADGAVQHFNGPVTVVLAGRLGTRISVEGRSFSLPVASWHVGDGAAYDVYVAPRSGLIVAMVPAGT